MFKKVAVDEFDFVQYAIDFGIMFGARDLDRIYVNRND